VDIYFFSYFYTCKKDALLLKFTRIILSHQKQISMAKAKIEEKAMTRPQRNILLLVIGITMAGIAAYNLIYHRKTFSAEHEPPSGGRL